MSLNVTKEVALLKQMTVGQLRERYLQVTGEATQAANRKWLVRRIIWRMQSIEEGGLSERAIARARELASGADLRTTAPKQRPLPADADRRTRVFACGQLGNVKLPLPGTLITRMYKGRQLQVRVVTGGFEYEGELFKSLSAVAKKITGSHWSGNKFFNLSDKEGKDPALLKQTTIDVQQRNHVECERLRDEQKSLARHIRDDHAKLQAIVANPNIASSLSGLSEIQARLETADRRSQQITSELAVLEAQKVDDQQITNVLAGFDELWQALPPKEQVRLVRLLIESVNFDGPGGNIAITFHPTGLKALTETQLEHAQ